VLPLFGGGLFGTALGFDEIALHVPLAVAALAYALVLVRVAAARAASAASPEGPEPGTLSRRTFVGRAAALGLLSLGASSLAVVGQAFAAARRTNADPDADFPPGGFGPTHAQTPVDRFYVVHKDLLAPVVDAAAWRLTIDGLVEAPASLSLDELRALPSLTAFRTLECISTSIVRGDDLIGNQKWRGVRVSDLLERVGPQGAAAWILWEAEDGFTESIPLEVARHPDTWIAYEMGDAPLTADHGFPARVLIPGRFGMKQPKWVRRMTLAADNVPGYWEQRGWDEQAIVRTMSRIDWPRAGDTVTADEAFGVYGIAFAGDRGIERVELSRDGGLTWQDAELEDADVPPLGELTWVRWRTDVTLGVGGTRLVVRATDGAGAVQDGRETSPLPSGSTGWHAVRVVAA
jgi:DMSO/TMAO reductase YedYZ molybdopterin-dependent catalytic subunit